MEESKTIKRLKRKLIKDLPSFPNNKETKEALESKKLTDLLIDYLSWKARLITPRKRKIIINNEVDITDNTITSILNSKNYINLKNKIESGDDLNPYLSLKAHDKGYSPEAKEKGNSWVDKDFILNVMNLYHFHLLPYEKDKQESTRTDELIFAKVDKTTFEIIGIFDHSIFKSEENTDALNLEREKLFKTWDNIIMKNIPDGSIIVPTSLITSGHTEKVVSTSMEYSKIIKEYDKKFNDIAFLNILYENKDIPNNPKLNWHFNGTDLGIIDKDNNFFILRHGKN